MDATPTPSVIAGPPKPEVTSYDELIQALGANAAYLQHLPSEEDVDELFDHHDETKNRSRSKRRARDRPAIDKLAFGSWRDGINPFFQVYIYLRPPSFANTEPSMMFTRYTSEGKYVEMNTKHVDPTNGAFTVIDLRRALILPTGKVHVDAVPSAELRCILKLN
jgi:hypothetical protein